MKKLIIPITLLFSILSCTNQAVSSSQNEKGKTTPASEKPKEATQEEEDIKEEASPEDEKNAELDKLKAKYKYVRAKLISVEAGDLVHHFFKTEGGKEIDFNIIEDNTYKLSVDDPNSESGLGINKKYKNKYFDIFYKVEKHDLLGWGTKENCDVVKKLILVE